MNEEIETEIDFSQCKNPTCALNKRCQLLEDVEDTLWNPTGEWRILLDTEKIRKEGADCKCVSLEDPGLVSTLKLHDEEHRQLDEAEKSGTKMYSEYERIMRML